MPRMLSTPLIWLCLLALPTSVSAREKPLWEVGLGVSALSFPAYRGADEQVDYLLPLPYLVYRGERLKVDREGVRGVLFDSDRAHLELSLNASTPVRSDDVDEREGMPDLDPVFELGPSLDFSLSEGGENAVWKLKFPLRGVFSVGGGVDHVGWLFHPKLSYSSAELLRGWGVGMSAGPLFADRRYHAYYYDVSPRYAAPGRDRYEARAGYSGFSVLASLSRRFPTYWVGGFVRYDNLSGARFENSPLVRSEHAIMVGVGIAWIIGRSKDAIAPALSHL